MTTILQLTLFISHLNKRACLADEIQEKLKEVELKWMSYLEIVKSHEKETLYQLGIEKEMLLIEKEESEQVEIERMQKLEKIIEEKK